MITLEKQNVEGCEPKTKIDIVVTDEPGDGGAHHGYLIEMPNGATQFIKFQKGPVQEAGFNGISIEALLAICEHRLACFQAGNFACVPNQIALDHINKALEALHSRTKDRMVRQVEGKSKL